MLLSPVQLIESYPVKILVEQNLKYSPDAPDHEKGVFKFDHMTNIDRRPGDEEHSTHRTYFSLIGIRSVKADESSPYRYQIIVSGMFSIDTSMIQKGNDPDDMAAKFSYTMLYGQAREMLVSATSRMRNGPVVLPTMSFMDATFSKAESTQGVEP
jgi:hypothetical protein